MDFSKLPTYDAPAYHGSGRGDGKYGDDDDEDFVSGRNTSHRSEAPPSYGLDGIYDDDDDVEDFFAENASSASHNHLMDDIFGEQQRTNQVQTKIEKIIEDLSDDIEAYFDFYEENSHIVANLVTDAYLGSDLHVVSQHNMKTMPYLHDSPRSSNTNEPAHNEAMKMIKAAREYYNDDVDKGPADTLFKPVKLNDIYDLIEEKEMPHPKEETETLFTPPTMLPLPPTTAPSDNASKAVFGTVPAFKTQPPANTAFDRMPIAATGARAGVLINDEDDEDVVTPETMPRERPSRADAAEAIARVVEKGSDELRRDVREMLNSMEVPAPEDDQLNASMFELLDDKSLCTIITKTNVLQEASTDAQTRQLLADFCSSSSISSISSDEKGVDAGDDLQKEINTDEDDDAGDDLQEQINTDEDDDDDAELDFF